MRHRYAALNAELGISGQLLASRGLLECEEASCLVVAEVGADGRNHLLIPAAARAWRDLKAAALGEGVSLHIVSAFRSVDRQADIIRRKLAAGVAIEDVLAVCAPPGFSEHHTGCAVDISTPGSLALDVTFEHTPAFVWLRACAADFDFRLSYPVGNACGFQYEPWHWCFVGGA
ncbi:M15 family metallopeptidase [Denitromonas iodatirespirans]|uniref:D-alanyl-D-alanine carboxypeptidase family protein n=1 Tax=Denitromonas iodatirespirans TaxID=2795389 RepID=A0A944D7K6_DENI1|nr:M15 family metallopeptidase [Denitromonas iodatirespirans]MBT0961424.1 D-alanyl-D-alanine carboxypeptidase family protein [Denitromonas iodatirespirans]